MPINNQSLNKELYKLLKVRGFDPIPKDSTGETSPVPDEADVFKFTFKQDGNSLGTAWATIDKLNTITLADGDTVLFNKGDSWVKVSSELPGRYYKSVCINSRGNVFVGSHEGGVYKSVDDGLNWKEVNIGFPFYRATALVSDSKGNIYSGFDGRGHRFPCHGIFLYLRM